MSLPALRFLFRGRKCRGVHCTSFLEAAAAGSRIHSEQELSAHRVIWLRRRAGSEGGRCGFQGIETCTRLVRSAPSCYSFAPFQQKTKKQMKSFVCSNCLDSSLAPQNNLESRVLMSSA